MHMELRNSILESFCIYQLFFLITMTTAYEICRLVIAIFREAST